MRLGRAALPATVLALIAGLAGAQTPQTPAFPVTTDRQDLVGWLRRETDITPAQVVAVSPSAVTAVLGAIDTASPRGMRMALRAEAIDAEVSAREGMLSWHMVVEADCEGHRLRLGETTGYVGRNLLGEGRRIRPGSETWTAPPAGAQLESVWRAACEPDFQRPLVTTRALSAPRAASPSLQLRPMLIQDLRTPVTRSASKPDPVVAPSPASAPPIVRMTAVVTPPDPPRAGATVQLGAMATRGAAEAMLAGLRTNLVGAMHGLSTRVSPAGVGGRTVYRALVTGFARSVDAQQFCAGLKTDGVACFVR